MSEKPAQDKRVTPANLLMAVGVVAVIQLFGLLVTKQNSPTYVVIVNSTGYSFNPAGSSPAGGGGNALILVVIAFALTLGMVWLLRRKMVVSFKMVIFGSVAFSSFVLTLLTADTFAVQYLPASLENPFAYGAAAVTVVLAAYTIFVKNVTWLSTALMAFIGAEVGSFFAETLSPYTALILPVAFAVYDIYAVFRGPLKELVGSNPAIALIGMSIKAGQFTVGLGDVVFYTMLPALALFRIGVYAALSTTLAIDVGVVVTLFFLSRRKLLPGLPIPMMLGVLAFLAYYL
jgi:Presenilin